MARKATQQQSADEWASAKFWVAAAGYAPTKPSALFGPSAPRPTVLQLFLAGESGAADAPALASGAAAVQRLLLGEAEDGTPISGFIQLDLTQLVPSGPSAVAAALDAEGAQPGPPGRTLGKPAARALEKLLGGGVSGVVLVACGGVAQLLLKLLRAGALRLSSVSQVVLLHPRLPPACVNAQLKNAPPAELPVHVLFESAATCTKRLPMLRHAFPVGNAAIARSSCTAALLVAALRLRTDATSPSPTSAAAAENADAVSVADAGELQSLPPFDAAAVDDLGRSLFLGELIFEMSRQTKQHEPVLYDATDRIGRGIREAELRLHRGAVAVPEAGSTPSVACVDDAAASVAAAAPTAPDAGSGIGGEVEVGVDTAASSVGGDVAVTVGSGGGREVGACILRGCRCVLVRSLATPPAWRGMRLPTVVRAASETQLEAAVRAASELCDIDGAAELQPLPQLPPVALHRPGCQAPALIFPLYAVRPPPPGPLEDADATDDEDLYDWYTWPRALAAVRSDEPTVGTLRTLACALAAAAAAGAVPNKWGGVFGQEWTGAFAHGTAQAEVRGVGGVGAAADVGAGGVGASVMLGSVGAGTTTLVRQNLGTRAVTAEPAGLRVSVVCGFVGAGKTTLLRHLLGTRAGVRVGVVVNDIAAFDAAALKQGGALEQEEDLVEVANGCICCRRREELKEAVARLAAKAVVDHLVVEASGVCVPMAVADAFLSTDDTGGSLASVAALDNLITVVDAAGGIAWLGPEADDPPGGQRAVTADAPRTLASLRIEQVEFANVIVINKADLVSATDLASLRASLLQLNPTAELIEAADGAVDFERLLGVSRFQPTAAERHPRWKNRSPRAERESEESEYGVTSFTFLAPRPLHPARLHAAFAAREGGALARLLRVKGIGWLATQYEQQALASLAGTQLTISPGPRWWAATAKKTWPEGLEEALRPLWREPHGERQVELVCIGHEMEQGLVRKALSSCLLSDQEFAAGPTAWAVYDDPFTEAWDFLSAKAAAERLVDVKNRARVAFTQSSFASVCHPCGWE